MQFLNKHVQGHVDVGHIDLLQKYAYFDVPEEDAKRVMKALNGQRYKRREVRCNDASDSQKPQQRTSAKQKQPHSSHTFNEKKQKFKKNDWKELLNPKMMKLKGEIPDFTEEGWALRRPRKK